MKAILIIVASGAVTAALYYFTRGDSYGTQAAAAFGAFLIGPCVAALFDGSSWITKGN